jgi:hypothetical protein
MSPVTKLNSSILQYQMIDNILDHPIDAELQHKIALVKSRWFDGAQIGNGTPL